MKLTLGTQKQYRKADKKGHKLWKEEQREKRWVYLQGLKRLVRRIA